MIHQQFLEMIREEISKLEHLIVHSGHIRNFEVFQNYIGRVKGLQDSLDIYLALLKGDNNEHRE
jgi:hypothetical protein